MEFFNLTVFKDFIYNLEESDLDGSKDPSGTGLSLCPQSTLIDLSGSEIKFIFNWKLKIIYCIYYLTKYQKIWA